MQTSHMQTNDATRCWRCIVWWWQKTNKQMKKKTPHVSACLFFRFQIHPSEQNEDGERRTFCGRCTWIHTVDTSKVIFVLKPQAIWPKWLMDSASQIKPGEGAECLCFNQRQKDASALCCTGTCSVQHIATHRIYGAFRSNQWLTLARISPKSKAECSSFQLSKAIVNIVVV